MTYRLIETREAKEREVTRGRQNRVETYVARVWACEATGLFVKTHTVQQERGFGVVSFSITGSLCDATGRAMRDERGEPLVRQRPHLWSFEPFQTNPDMEKLAGKMAEDSMAAHRYVVALIENAALARMVARAAL